MPSFYPCRMWLLNQGSDTQGKSLAPPGSQFSLLSYGVIRQEDYEALPNPVMQSSACPDKAMQGRVSPGWELRARKKRKRPAPTHPSPGDAAPHTSMLELKARFTLALIFTTCPALERGKQEVSLPGGTRGGTGPAPCREGAWGRGWQEDITAQRACSYLQFSKQASRRGDPHPLHRWGS